jgi:hypothetical protein
MACLAMGVGGASASPRNLPAGPAACGKGLANIGKGQRATEIFTYGIWYDFIFYVHRTQNTEHRTQNTEHRTRPARECRGGGWFWFSYL